VRICFISRRFFPTISGMSVYALNLVRQLEARGHDVVMVSQYYGGEAAGVYGDGPPMPVGGVEVIGMESTGEQSTGDFEGDIARMLEVIGRKHADVPFDVIHAQYGYPTGLAAVEAGRRLGVPSVVSIQGGDGHWVGSCCETHRRAMVAVLGHAGALLIGSRSFARSVSERLGTPEGRFTIVPGAVNVERFRPEPGREIGTMGDTPTLLYHGRVDRRKGVLDLLEALRLLNDERAKEGESAVLLALSGIGPDVDAAAGRIEALGLGDRVDVLGYAAYEDAPARYHTGDIFVSPTYAEGFSNTILEAMASGLPIVSCEVVGVVDCLEDGRNALLVPPERPAALAEAIQRMLTDDALRVRLAREGYREAQTEYAWSARAEQIEGVYRSLQSTHSSTPSDGYPTGLLDAEPDPCRFRETPQLL
jgi:glycosyltransferase involved in cell wall biosynthesis